MRSSSYRLPHLLLSLLCLLLLSLAGHGHAMAGCDNVCEKLVVSDFGMVVTDSQLLQECYRCVPFDATAASETLDSLDYLVEMYSFTDLAFNATLSGSPYDITVDLHGEIFKIREKATANEFENDYDFHIALVRLFVKLRDAHTRYAAPLGYRSTLVKPFGLEVKMIDDHMHFFLAAPRSAGITQLFQSVAGFDSTPHFGREVVLIDGEPILDSLKNFADNFVGTYKDLQVRFNALLRHGGGWENIATIRFGLDLPSKYQYQVLGVNGNTTVITVPTLAIVGYNDTLSVAEIQKRNLPAKSDSKRALTSPCELSSSTSQCLSAESLPAFVNPLTEIEDELAALFEQVGGVDESAALLKRDALNATALIEVIEQTADASFTYMLYNKTTPIIKLSTFAPVGRDDEYLNGTVFLDFLNTTQRAYADITAHNYTELVFDVSRNGGGLICLAYDFLASFVAEWDQYNKDFASTVWSLYDVRTSHVYDIELESDEGRQSRNANAGNPSTRDYYTDDNSWYSPGKSYNRGGKISRYTEKYLFPFSCGNPEIPLLDPPGWPTQKIPSLHKLDKLIVLTDGTCGSACSLFTTKMQAHEKAYVVSYGGILKSYPMETSSFAGGNVLDFDQIHTDLVTLNLTSKIPLKKLTTSAYARFNSHETYKDADSDLPREFIRIAADQHLDMWGAVRDNSVVLGGDINPALAELYSAVVPLLAEVPGGRLAATTPWVKPTINPIPLTEMWTYVAVGAGVVVVITIVLVVILQCKRRKDDYEAISGYN